MLGNGSFAQTWESSLLLEYLVLILFTFHGLLKITRLSVKKDIALKDIVLQ
jgi:hypothetical protein